MADRPGATVATIGVEVAYAGRERQRVIALQVPAGASARDVVRLSGIATEFTEIDPDRCPVGVFGERVADEYSLEAGDRLEIYRPLRVDPREARRERARRNLEGAD